jgi:hypothetical protein
MRCSKTAKSHVISGGIEDVFILDNDTQIPARIVKPVFIDLAQRSQVPAPF